jgi:multidrug efflux system membrane fusion protein
MLVAVIADGLEPGERVVVDGASRLTDGAKVQVATPPDAPAPGEPRRRGPPETASRRAPGAT